MIDLQTGGNQTEFARRIGEKQATFNGYLDENNEHRVKINTLRKIAETFGVDLNWLITGHGVEPGPEDRRPAATGYGEPQEGADPSGAASPVSQGYDGGKPWRTIFCGPPGADRLETATADRPVGVVTSLHKGPESGRPLEYRGLAEAGDPGNNGLEAREHSMGQVALREDLARTLLGEDGRGLWMRVTERGMLPDVQPGDLALVNLASTRIEPGRIYAVAVQGITVLRMLDLASGRWSLTTPTGDSMPYDPAAAAAGVQILGRVVWIGREV